MQAFRVHEAHKPGHQEAEEGEIGPYEDRVQQLSVIGVYRSV